MIDINSSDIPIEKNLHQIVEKVVNDKRISEQEGLRLFTNGSLALLGSLANSIREEKNGDKTYFNRNIHIEPTNICVFDCKFCSYSRLLKHKQEGWEASEEDILNKIREYKDQPITEVHIVGGVHPKMGLHYFASLIQKVKAIKPDIHVKAYTAV